MNSRIVFQLPGRPVAVVIPGECGLTLEQIGQKDVPKLSGIFLPELSRRTNLGSSTKYMKRSSSQHHFGSLTLPPSQQTALSEMRGSWTLPAWASRLVLGVQNDRHK